MTNEQKLLILSLRAEGLGYRKVADKLGISENTVKSFCRRQKEAPQVDAPTGSVCKCCGAPIQQTPGRKEKKFCSDKCRREWWNSHLDQVDRRAIYEMTCPGCGKRFTVYGKPSSAEDFLSGSDHKEIKVEQRRTSSVLF